MTMSSYEFRVNTNHFQVYKTVPKGRRLTGGCCLADTVGVARTRPHAHHHFLQHEFYVQQ